MTVYLVRHGESLANLYKDLPLQRGFGGMTDDRVPLTQWGYDQAVEAGKVLAHELRQPEHAGRQVKIIYSPFLRAAQTTRGILRQLDTGNLRAVTDDDLREQHFGLFSCITDCKLIAARWPEENAQFVAERRQDKHTAKPPGGESRAEVVMRAEQLIERHRADFENPDMDIILVGHGLINRSVEMCLRGLDIDWLRKEPNPQNGAIRKLEGNLALGYTLPEPPYIHQGRQRPPSLPKDHKTAIHDGERELTR